MDILELFPKPILLEDQKQTDLEQLARLFFAHYINRCMEYLPGKIAGHKAEWGDLRNPFWISVIFPGAMLRDVFPNGKGLKAFSQPIQNFIKARGTLRLHADEQRGSAIAHYKPNANVQPEICLFISDKTYKEFANTFDNGVKRSAVASMFAGRASSLVHELQHAYDDWASKGRFRKRSVSADKDPNGYLTSPHEISAWYRHTVADLKMTSDWREYLREFMWAFKAWKLVDHDVQRRLVKRLAAHWLSQQRQPERDITPEFKVFTQRLKGDYKGVYLSYRETANAIEIDSFGTKDKSQIDAILQAVIRFADIRKKMVCTGDVPYGPKYKAMGFVNQRTSKHNYALPIATTMYRPARQSKIEI